MDNLFNGTQRQRKRKEGRNDVKLNPALAPPYAQKWPEIQRQHQRMILEEIESIFHSKIADQLISKKRKQLIQKRPEDSPKKIEELLMSIFSKKEKYRGKDLTQLVTSPIDPSKLNTTQELREFLMMGVRDITRSIEKNVQFHVVICCGSSDNWICQNLLCLALLSNIPVCSLKGLSDVITEFIGIKQVTAIAFKKVVNNPFKELGEFVIDKIPDVLTPWVRLWGQNYPKNKVEGSATKEVEDNTIEHKKNTEPLSSNTPSDETTMSSCGDSKILPKKTKVDGTGNDARNDIQYLEMNIAWKDNKKITSKKGNKSAGGVKQICKK